jgi:cystathionine beta-synthase
MTSPSQNPCLNVLEAIGHTPLVRVNRLAKGLGCPIYAKIEFMNPGGSVKDRVAMAMVELAEREGRLKPGGTIVEATSGNTGVGLAMVAAVKGYRCIFVMPDKMSAEKIRLLKAYGAEVVITPASADSNSAEGYGGVAERLINEIPNAWRPNQFANLANPDFHYQTTGPEIWEQTGGRVSVFVAGIGTGGTISGVGKYLKEKQPKVRVVAADPEGSILSGDKPRPWAVEGIGEDFVPSTFSAQVVDDWVRVSDRESFHVARQLARLEGLLVGGSSGTAMAAALKYAQRLTEDDVVVCLCPDTGRNYLSKLYSDEWMIENGFLDSASRRYTVAELLAERPSAPILFVHPDQLAEDAVILMREHGVSQIPVVEEDQVVGCVRELTLARLLYGRMDPKQVPVREVMARAMPVVSELVDLDEVYRLLSAGNTGVMVRRSGRIGAIVTQIDLIDFWDRHVEPAPANAAP